MPGLDERVGGSLRGARPLLLRACAQGRGEGRGSGGLELDGMSLLVHPFCEKDGKSQEINGQIENAWGE